MEVGKIDLKSLNRNHIESYITKEELIEIINNIYNNENKRRINK